MINETKLKSPRNTNGSSAASPRVTNWPNDEESRKETSPAIPTEKQTVLGLYATAKEAYEKWEADPDHVKILDVRTPEEFLFVGFPTMAWKIPVADQAYEWDASRSISP